MPPWLRGGSAIRRGGPATDSSRRRATPGPMRRSAGSRGGGGRRGGRRLAMATSSSTGRRGPCRSTTAASSPQSRAGASSPRCSRPRPAIEVEVLRGNGVREGGVLLRGARRDPRARRQGAARGGARRRDRGRSDALREGGRVAAVLADEGPLPPRVEVPRPPLGKREGVRRERRRPPSREPPRPGSVRRVRGRARREAACRLRAHRPHLAQQVRGARDEGAPRRLRGDGVPPGRALRLRQVAGGKVGQAGPRPRGRRPLLRRARLARPGPRGGRPRQQRLHARGPQSPRRDPAQVLGGGRAHREPPLPRAGDRRAAEGDRGAGHTPRHARRPRGGHRRRGGPQVRQAPGAIGRAAATSGSGAACEAARRAFGGGRVPDDAFCDVLARRVAAGERDGGGAGPAACDRLVGEGARLRAA